MQKYIKKARMSEEEVKCRKILPLLQTDGWHCIFSKHIRPVPMAIMNPLT
jgi:hypothetical protein